MPRYKLTIEYDGTGLVGWQRQANGLSVQGALETAITSFCGERTTIHGAGRTDAGVHALAQTAHLDLTRAVAPEVLRSAVNHHLRPAAISVLAAEAAPDEVLFYNLLEKYFDGDADEATLELLAHEK